VAALPWIVAREGHQIKQGAPGSVNAIRIEYDNGDGELLSEWTYVAGAPVSAKDYVYAGGRLIAVVTRAAH